MAGREDLFQKAMNIGHSMAWDLQWDKAAVAYRKALEEFPDNPKALSSLGLALFEQQHYDESLQVYQKAARRYFGQYAASKELDSREEIFDGHDEGRAADRGTDPVLGSGDAV